MYDFLSFFDLYRAYAASLSTAQPIEEWGQLPDGLVPEMTPEAAFELLAPLAWNAPVEGPPDPSMYGGDLTRTQFGDIGGDGQTFYYFDPDSGSSVMI